MKASHTQVLAANGVRYSLRSGSGIVYVILTITLGLTIASIVIEAVNLSLQVVAQGQVVESEPPRQREQIEAMIENLEGPITSVVRFLDPVPLALNKGQEARDLHDYLAVTRHLTQDNPVVLTLILGLFLLLLPLSLAIGAFNQISGDVEYKGLRYLLLRTTRADVYFGRFVGTTLFCLTVMVVLVTTIGVFVQMEFPVQSASESLVWSGHFLVAILLLTPPYVAFFLGISAWVDTPFGSLMVCQLAALAAPILAFLGRAAWEPLGNLMYLSPFGVTLDLLHPDFGRVFLAGLACFGYTAVYLYLGYRRFSRRDL